MPELIIQLSDAEWDALGDLADAQNRTAEEFARQAVRDHLQAERAQVGAVAARLALRYAPLLERLGR